MARALRCAWGHPSASNKRCRVNADLVCSCAPSRAHTRAAPRPAETALIYANVMHISTVSPWYRNVTVDEPLVWIVHLDQFWLIGGLSYSEWIFLCCSVPAVICFSVSANLNLKEPNRIDSPFLFRFHFPGVWVAEGEEERKRGPSFDLMALDWIFFFYRSDLTVKRRKTRVLFTAISSVRTMSQRSWGGANRTCVNSHSFNRLTSLTNRTLAIRAHPRADESTPQIQSMMYGLMTLAWWLSIQSVGLIASRFPVADLFQSVLNENKNPMKSNQRIEPSEWMETH